MKNTKFYLLLVLAFAITLVSCKTEKKEEVKNVCAKWSDVWYEAVVVSETDGKIHVKYYDNAEADLTSADIKYPLAKDKIKVNDRVLAVWTTGKYYPGTVTEVKEEGAMVTWDDGSSASLVAYGKIVEGFPKVEKMTYLTCTGKSICAKWGETSWYEAKIVSETDGVIHAIYYDNYESDITAADIKELITDKSQVKVKDKVLGVWTSGLFYPGTVTKIEDAGITVKWDDGSTPSIVAFGKFVKQ